MTDSPSDASSAENQPATKRRRTRKGTRSCWECKRRKVRCSFSTSAAETVCVACRRRGSKCLGQDLPEEQSNAENHVGTPNEHIARVETLLQRFAKDIGQSTPELVPLVPTAVAGSHQQPVGIPSPASTSGTGSLRSSTQHHLPPSNTSIQRDEPSIVPSITLSADLRDHKWILELLVAALPSSKDLDILCDPRWQTAVYLFRTNTKSYKSLLEDGFDGLSDLRQSLSSSRHPVLLAKHMLKLAIRLNTISDRGFGGIADDRQVLEKKLARTVIRSVTTNDELVGSAEFLECQILESIYHWNCGNLRRAWTVSRRAVATAQSLGIHRRTSQNLKSLEANRKVCKDYLWSRASYIDTMFSLMLRLPSGIASSSQTSHPRSEHESPNVTLERAHTAIAARILGRNEGDTELKDDDTLRQIDADLVRAASCVPSDFWSYPNPSEQQIPSTDAFWDVVRMINQVYHYTLINLLHLPYLLTHDEGGSHDYSKMMCVTSSREILMRLGANRANGIIATYCRPAHFFILMAAITLVLAHLDSHRTTSRPSTLAHQRFGDRATIEQVLESMETYGRLSEDALSAKSATFLKGLLDAEMDTSKGQKYDIAIGDLAEANLGDESHVLRICLPYFGSIRITRQNFQRNDRNHFSANLASMSAQPAVHEQAALAPLEPLSPSMANALGLDAETSVGQQDEQGASLAMTDDDWVFGDVDTAFFESMMSGGGDFNIGFSMDDAWAWTMPNGA